MEFSSQGGKGRFLAFFAPICLNGVFECNFKTEIYPDSCMKRSQYFSTDNISSKTSVRWLSEYYNNYNCFTAPWTVSRTTRVRQYQKGKSNMDLLERVAVASAGPYANLHLAPDR